MFWYTLPATELWWKAVTVFRYTQESKHESVRQYQWFAVFKMEHYSVAELCDPTQLAQSAYNKTSTLPAAVISQPWTKSTTGTLC